MSAMDFEIVEPEVPNKVKETNIVSRKNIENNKQVKLVDSQDGLDLFCYVKCDEEDSDLLKKCRGVVFEGDSLVMNGFPYTHEYTCNDHEVISKKIEPIFDQCSVYDSHEGSVIRMFNYNGKWYITTNRKLDANKSKWSSKESFGFFFKQALEVEIEINETLRNNIPKDDTKDIVENFQSLLDPSKQYMFLLLNNEQNRIVCNAPERPTVFHVGTFINGVLSMEENIYIPYPRRHTFSCMDELYSYVDSVDIQKVQGVIIFAPENKQYKVFNVEYYDLYKVRGNEPSIKFRYLQVRMNKRYNNLLHYLYPSFSKVFDDYENIIYAIAKFIHKSYLDRFVRNQYTSVPGEEFNVIRACHSWHLENRETNKINLNKVIDVLNAQPATNINKMIRRFYLEQQNKDKQPSENLENTDTNFPEISHQKNRQRPQRQKYKPFLNRNKGPTVNDSSEKDKVETPEVETV